MTPKPAPFFVRVVSFVLAFLRCSGKDTGPSSKLGPRMAVTRCPCSPVPDVLERWGAQKTAVWLDSVVALSISGAVYARSLQRTGFHPWE